MPSETVFRRHSYRWFRHNADCNSRSVEAGAGLVCTGSGNDTAVVERNDAGLPIVGCIGGCLKGEVVGTYFA